MSLPDLRLWSVDTSSRLQSGLTTLALLFVVTSGDHSMKVHVWRFPRCPHLPKVKDLPLLLLPLILNGIVLELAVLCAEVALFIYGVHLSCLLLEAIRLTHRYEIAGLQWFHWGFGLSIYIPLHFSNSHSITSHIRDNPVLLLLLYWLLFWIFYSNGLSLGFVRRGILMIN